MASRYWVGGTANWDNTAGTKWATTSGGAGGAAVPTSSDDVFFDASSGSGNCTITATANCLSLNFSGFTGTLSGSSSLNIIGNLTLSSGMTITFTGTTTISSTATLTSNGKTWSSGLTFSGTSSTITIADNWVIVDTLNIAATPITINGNTIEIGGGFSSSGITTGTTNIILAGTGTLQTTGGGRIGLTTTINTSGTITLGALLSLGSITFTHISGTVVNTGNTLTFSGAQTPTLNTSGMTWNNVSFTIGGAVITLTSAWNIAGTAAFGTSSQNTTINGSDTVITGSFSTTNAASVLGTSTFQITGTGSWSGTPVLRNNLTINTTGTFTVSGSVAYSTGTLTYIAGTVVTAGSTLLISNTAVLNTNGISWDNVSISAGTCTLNSLLTSTGTMTLAGTGNVTFSGTSGFTSGTLVCTVAGRTINFATGKTYSITGSLMILGNHINKISFVSTSTGALFNLQSGATQQVEFCNATWINSSGGQTIFTKNPTTLSNTTNWNVVNPDMIPFF